MEGPRLAVHRPYSRRPCCSTERKSGSPALGVHALTVDYRATAAHWGSPWGRAPSGASVHAGSMPHSRSPPMPVTNMPTRTVVLLVALTSSASALVLSLAPILSV